MLQDIEAGKKTEIDYMNGAVVRHGQQLGIDTPVNSFLTDMVLSIEKLNLSGNKEMNAAERNHCEL
jgi:2-dehydropantoate 2-reductase